MKTSDIDVLLPVIALFVSLEIIKANKDDK